MKNKLIFLLESKLKLHIKGKNINNFIKRLNDHQIDIISISNLKYNEAIIVIYKNDYDKLMELKTIYEVTQKEIYGIIKVRKIIGRYKYFFIIFVLAIIFLYYISNVIFSVDIISENNKINKLLLDELSNYGIRKYQHKKSFKNITSIKQEILTKHKDKLEWLEIDAIGTKYIVKYEERIILTPKDDGPKKQIVAKKNAIIKKIIAHRGTVLKEINQYVKKDDIIISGDVVFNEQIKEPVGAKGQVFGEVWYTVTVEYPYIYNEIKETKNKKEIYVLKILNKDIEFTLKKYKEKNKIDENIFNHSLIPIQLVKQKQIEVQSILLVLTKEEAINMALNEAHQKVLKTLKTNEKIIKHHILEENIMTDKVILKVFFSVLEDISLEQDMKEGE